MEDILELPKQIGTEPRVPVAIGCTCTCLELKVDFNLKLANGSLSELLFAVLLTFWDILPNNVPQSSQLGKIVTLIVLFISSVLFVSLMKNNKCPYRV
ncbi:hypothetical protein GDO78_008494 [Eleutherodactylus coqui]|uniref:Uncharacterized protein n=1 Tax=Eleutherodactylus coqui TaxID=57060 RepID=A0A8J6K979_ELECQ|nr:hypothetical protein GDO78_008494 [Eleutherodactylus coqui]